MVDVLRSQLLACRAQIDAMLTVLDSVSPLAESSLREPPLSASCPHTETENIGTFGAPAYKCLACGRKVDVDLAG